MLSAPCHVFIHGDFNVNNVFYTTGPGPFGTSIFTAPGSPTMFRTPRFFWFPIIGSPSSIRDVRKRLNGVISVSWRSSRNFHGNQKIRFFEARMALALVRSFYTSTRFELNPDFSRRMFLSAHFLMESLVSHQKSWEEFKIPRRTSFSTDGRLIRHSGTSDETRRNRDRLP
jgi:hypothetical protein